ncbi:hypothetical protein niasHS_016293 [Heterodera schachtii]|uniref:Uncharacterized protein n=1 Tax=Heterodera schachtii TaxID=97005 RepID=A0ABD2HZS8_HETSC
MEIGTAADQPIKNNNHDWEALLNKAQIDQGEMAGDELMIQLSQNEVLIEAALKKDKESRIPSFQFADSSQKEQFSNRFLMLKNGVEKMREKHPKMASMMENLYEKIAKLKKDLMDGKGINDSQTNPIKLAIKKLMGKFGEMIGVKFAEIKLIKLQSHSEFFKIALELLKFMESKNAVVDNEKLTKLFGLAKTFLDSSVISEAKQQLRRRKRVDPAVIGVEILGIFSCLLFLSIIVYHVYKGCTKP